MAKSLPTYLRLYNEIAPKTAGRLKDFWPGLDKLGRAFERVTGWPLRFLPEPADAMASGDVRWSAPAAPAAISGEELHVGIAAIEDVTQSPAQVDLQASVDLAAAIGHLLSDLAHARQALWKREAELAAGVPLAVRTNEAHLARRLESALRAAAEAVDGSAAALYLLDETTTYLKLRSLWGLPQERLLLPPRELARATADLEALLGHAVVLDDAANADGWQVPEPAGAAICVPVSSATAPLGTLWIFADQPREYSDREVNMVEVVAGRVAVELEREMLVAASVDAGRAKRQFAAAERWQEARLPRIVPTNEPWQVAGWAQSSQELNGEFYDWFQRPDDSLVTVLGGTRKSGIEAALEVSALATAVRAHAQYAGDPAVLLTQVHETLRAGSPGDASGALLVAVAEPNQLRLRVATAGDIAVWRMTAAGPVAPVAAAPMLGGDDFLPPRAGHIDLERGDFFLALSEGAVRVCREAGCPQAENELLAALGTHRHEPAQVLIEIVHDRLTALASGSTLADCAALVVKPR